MRVTAAGTSAMLAMAFLLGAPSASAQDTKGGATPLPMAPPSTRPAPPATPPAAPVIPAPVMLAPPPRAAPPVVTTEWYGYQNLIVDGASLALGIGIGAEDAGAGVAVFSLGYTLGGPTVHWAHGHLERGFASLGLRVGAPIVTALLGGLVGLAASPGSDSDGIEAGFVVGGAIGGIAGYVIAVAVDDCVLAREPVSPPPAPGTTAASPAPSFTLAPSFSRLREGGATLGVSGTF